MQDKYIRKTNVNILHICKEDLRVDDEQLRQEIKRELLEAAEAGVPLKRLAAVVDLPEKALRKIMGADFERVRLAQAIEFGKHLKQQSADGNTAATIFGLKITGGVTSALEESEIAQNDTLTEAMQRGQKRLENREDSDVVSLLIKSSILLLLFAESVAIGYMAHGVWERR